jgi:hypothetical protein
MMNGGEERRSRNAHLMHMTGTILVGTWVVAVLAAIRFAIAPRPDWLHIVITIIVLAVLLGTQCMGFKKITANQSSLVNIALLDGLQEYHSGETTTCAQKEPAKTDEHRQDKGERVKTVWISKWDLKKQRSKCCVQKGSIRCWMIAGQLAAICRGRWRPFKRGRG